MANSYDVRLAQFQPKQEIINWNTCTAEEILTHEQNGQEVPEEYLRWAEEMSAAMNVQDDVTYEMANTTPGGENANGNAAQNFRTQLADSGVSLRQQGQIFISESRGKEEDTLGHIEQMGAMLNQTQALDDDAQAVADETETQLKAITDEINAQVDNMKKKPFFFRDRQEQGEIQGLRAVAGALANAANTQIEGIAASAEEIESEVNLGAVSSQLAQDYGSETVGIGAQLLGKKHNSGFFGAMESISNFMQDVRDALFGGIAKALFGISSNRRVGRDAVEQGSETFTVGQQGMEIAQEVAEANDITIQGIGQVQDVATDADAAGTDAGDDTGAEPQNGEGQEPTLTAAGPANQSQSAKTADEEDNSLTAVQEDPSKILTDPNEIIKRKERKGLT